MARRTVTGLAPSAPDLVGPVSLLSWPVAYRAGKDGRRPHRFSHVQMEIDLVPEMEEGSRIPLLRRLEDALRELEIYERGSLPFLVGASLHAFAAAGFRRVDHWEVRPGGWLPLHALPRGPQIEPIGQFIRSLELDQWKRVADAREFAARLSGPAGNRLGFTLRRVHRERHHTLSLDLSGSLTPRDLNAISAALHRRLSVMHSEVSSVVPYPSRRSGPAARARAPG